MAKTIKIPTNFSYTGSFSVTTAAMHGADREGKIIGPVEVKTKTVRGVIGHEKHATALAKGEASNKTEDANIQRVDCAELPFGADHLLVEYSIKVLPNAWSPNACNCPKLRSLMQQYIASFTEKGGMKELARLYVEQMMSDEWLWRNSDGLDIKVLATARARGINDINVTYHPLDNDGDDLQPLIDLVTEVLENKRRVAFIKIRGLVELVDRAEVYPSQEFVDKKDKGAAKKSKTLFAIVHPDGTQQAAMHSQKVGNALRRIDSWHGGDHKIAVEMYGIDQQNQMSYRPPVSNTSFFDYLKRLPSLIEALDKGLNDDHLYFTACLMRGGVMGAKSDDKAA